MDSLLFDFNKVINKIIENITNDIFFQNNLNYCYLKIYIFKYYNYILMSI